MDKDLAQKKIREAQEYIVEMKQTLDDPSATEKAKKNAQGVINEQEQMIKSLRVDAGDMPDIPQAIAPKKEISQLDRIEADLKSTKLMVTILFVITIVTLLISLIMGIAAYSSAKKASDAINAAYKQIETSTEGYSY